MKTLQTLAFALVVALTGAPIAAQAQVAADPMSGHRPTVDTSGNGIPVVNITAPTQGGVSHNQYQNFNVDPKGLILNNSSGISQTQQAGYIVGNTNLANGQSARIILNEVTSQSISNLNGFTEVAGNRAEVIIANPNGITCNGCGFINTSRGTLVTGTPVFGGDGSLAAFRVTRGTLAINGAGLNGTGTDRLDLIARTVAANAKIWANELNVITGANQVNYFDLSTQLLKGEGETSGVSLDVAALGGMYANKIRLIGTEGGVGVRNAGELATTSGDFTITQAGRLELTGKTSATGQITLKGASLSNSGTLAAGTNLNVSSTGAIDNTGTIYGTTDTNIVGGMTLTNNGKVYAVGGSLNVDVDSLANNTGGDIYSGKDMTLRAGSIDNAAAIQSGGVLALHASDYLSNAATGSIGAGNSLGLEVAGDVTNSGQIYATTDASLHAGSLTNNKVIDADGRLSIASDGDIVNTDTMQAGLNLALHAVGSTSNSGKLYAIGGSLLATAGGRFDNAATGDIYGKTDVHVIGDAIGNAGSAEAGGNLTVDATNTLDNSGKLLADTGNAELDATDIVQRGVVSAVNDVTLAASNNIDHSGTTIADHDIDIVAESITNGADATLLANGKLHGDVRGLLSNAGTLASKGDVTIVAGSLLSSGVLGAGVQADGSLGTTGILDATVAGALAVHGDALAAAGLILKGGSLDLGKAHVRAGGDIALTASAGDIDATGGDIATAGKLGVSATGALMNRAGTLQGGSLDVQAASLDNTGGTLTHTGAGDEAIAVTGMLDNSNGHIASNAKNLNLRAGSIINNGGSVEHAGDGTLSIDASGGIANRAGHIVGNGELDLDTNGALDSTGGTISLTRGATIDAVSFANDSGTLVSSALAITLAGNLGNNGGTLQSNGATTITAGSLVNGTGQIKALSADVARLTIAGALSSGVGGFIGGNGGLWLRAGSIDNSGQFYATTTADVASTNGNIVNRGAIQSMGSSSVVSSASLINDGGRIESGAGDTTATLTVKGTGFSNVGGRIANSGTGQTGVTAVGTIANQNGTLGGQGNVAIAGAGLANAGGGVIAGRDMALTLGGFDNTGGNVYAGGNLTWSNGGATLTNTNGQFGSGTAMALTLGLLQNANGNTSSNGNVTLNLAQGISGSGRIVAGNDLDVTLSGSFTNAAGSQLKANHNFGLHLGGAFINADGATLAAVGGLTIDAASIDNGVGSSIDSVVTTLNSRSTLNNRGRIEGDSLTLTGGDIANTGTLIGDDILVRASNLTNGSDLGGAVDNNAYQSALIAATHNITLLVAGSFINRDALLFSLGDIFVAADTNAGRAQQIVNNSGDIEADGSIVLAANQITNQRRVFETQTVSLAGAPITNVSGPVVRYRYDDPDPNHRPPNVDPSQVISAEEVEQARAFCANAGFKDNRCIGFQSGDGSPVVFQGVNTNSLLSYEALSRVSAESRVAAGGNITLLGSVTNDKSTVAAAQNLVINGAGQTALGEGDTNVGGEVIRNIAWNPTGTVQTTAVYGVGWESLIHDPRRWEPNGFKDYGNATSSSVINLGDGQRPSWITVDPGQGLAGRMTAGNALEIHGTTITNTTVGADGRPISGVGLGANAGGSNVSGSGAGAVGAAGGSIDMGGVGGVAGVGTVTGDVRNAGPRPGSQTVDTLHLPDSGLYTSHPGGGSQYLIETDPRFASQAGFLGSDYLMNRLGFNGEDTMKRLGDGFYEQRLVLDQITSLTGRRYLDNNSDAMSQYRALMDAGVDAAGKFQLAVGVALTADQMANLTQDIVWMVSKQVEGETVLVPVVYLSAAHAQEVAQNGAILSGKTVVLDASGTVTNTGTIAATQDASIKAGTLLNAGNLSAGGNLSVTAAQDILNAGTIKGGNVSLSAGNDILSGADVGRVDLGGLKLGDTVSALDAKRMGLGSAGSITATGNLAASAGRDLTLNVAPVNAGGNLSLSAGRDLTATATAIKAGGDAQLVAGRDLSLNAIGQTVATQGGKQNSESTTHTVTTVEAGGNAILAAGRDVVSQGANAKAGDQVAVSAGRDVVLSAITDTQRTDSFTKEGKTAVRTGTMDQTLSGTSIAGTNGVTVSAGRDLEATAVNIVSDKGGVALAAGYDVKLNAGSEEHVQDTETKKTTSGAFSSKSTRTHDTIDDLYAVGSTIHGGDSVSIAAGNDITLQGAIVTSEGAIALAAGRDINLEATHDSYNETYESEVRKSGLVINRGAAPVYQGKTTDSNRRIQQTIARGTTLSGDTVTAAAGRNLVGEAAQIAATHDVLLAAGNDLTLTTAENTYSKGQETSVITTGYSQSGLNEHYGTVKDSRGEGVSELTHMGSLVGSTGGSVTVTAGGDMRLTGTDVMSKVATTIVGKNVTIDAAIDAVDAYQYQRHNEGGITGGLGGKIVELAMDARQSIKRGDDVEDSRLKALYAAKAAYAVSDAVDVMKNGTGSAAQGDEGINVQVSIGGSSSSSKTTTHDETAFGSNISSQGDVVIAATGGDLNIIGSKVNGNNVGLAASHDINLLSQAENHSLKNDSKNGAGGIGVSIGSNGVGIYAEASIGSGQAHGNGLTHSETTIDAENILTLVSGNDATIQGAQLKGRQVISNIGNDLTIRSEQDTDDYASKAVQAGGRVMVGVTQSGFVSGSAYYSQSKIDSHYQSVNEVSGIKAGDGGFQLVVGGTTHLIGGQIASAADASKNFLITGDFVYEDLHNESKYKASQVTFSGGSTLASNISGAIGAAVGMLTPQSGNDSSDTRSGVGAGTIIVRNNLNQDLSGLDRSPTLGTAALKNVFDAEKVAETHELGQISGEVGFRAAGTVADKLGWPEGSNERILLHGVVGAAVAALGGRDAIDGLKGAASSEAASAAMQYFLASKGVTPGSDEYNALMEAASATIGAVVGGGTGAAVALDGDKFNRQLHKPLIKDIREELAQQYADKKGISVDDARGILLRAAMTESDGFASKYLTGLDSEADRTEAMIFLYTSNPITPSGTQFELRPSDADIANSSLGAADLVNDKQALADVLQAMNPTGDPAKDEALRDYFNKVSLDERLKDKFDDDSLEFLAFNGKLALAGGLGAGLAATGELGMIATKGAAQSAASYTVMALARAEGSIWFAQKGSEPDFSTAFYQNFSESGLVGSAAVGGVGAAYLGQMFRWAGLPASGASWITPAGAILRGNSAVTSNLAGKATQAISDSNKK